MPVRRVARALLGQGKLTATQIAKCSGLRGKPSVSKRIADGSLGRPSSANRVKADANARALERRLMTPSRPRESKKRRSECCRESRRSISALGCADAAKSRLRPPISRRRISEYKATIDHSGAPCSAANLICRGRLNAGLFAQNHNSLFVFTARFASSRGYA